MTSPDPVPISVVMPKITAEMARAVAEHHGVPLTALGRTGGDTLSVEGAFELPVAEAKAAWRATLPAVFHA